MTDKDPKDMTVSELLRWLADDDDQSNCQACSRFYASDECGGKMCSDWKRDLADKIDAELAQARKSGFDDFKLADWYYSADANGWPKPRDDESLHEYVDRCFIPRPRFEDGEPVQMGDEIAIGGGSIDVNEAVMLLDGSGYRLLHSTDVSASAIEDRVKRPAPEVLGADGLPLNEDDTVYGTGREQHRYTVQVPYSINEEVGKRFCVQCYDHDEGNITWCDPSMLTHERPVLGADGLPIKVGETVWLTDEGNAHIGSVNFKAGPRSHGLCCVEVGEPLTVLGIKPKVRRNDHRFVAFDHHASPWCDASWLTHTPPETQERIDADAAKVACNYFQHDGNYCEECPVYDRKGLRCNEAMILDLLRRQRELDKRTGGAE